MQEKDCVTIRHIVLKSRQDLDSLQLRRKGPEKTNLVIFAQLRT